MKLKNWTLAFLGCLLWLKPILATEKHRIVSLNGTLTELIYQLGAGSELVGVDTTSTFPEESLRIARVGYQRALSAEGILSLSPTRVLGTDAAGPPTVFEQLGKLNLPILLVKDGYTLEALEEKIINTSKFLNKEKDGIRLVKELQESLKKVKIEKLEKPIKVLFIHSRGNTNLFTAGTETPVDSLITLSGAKNASSGFKDFKALSAEAMVASLPDVLLVPKKSLESIGGEKALWSLPSIQLTRAGKEKNLLVMEDIHFIGLGLRIPEVIQEMNKKWKSLQ